MIDKTFDETLRQLTEHFEIYRVVFAESASGFLPPDEITESVSSAVWNDAALRYPEQRMAETRYVLYCVRSRRRSHLTSSSLIIIR